ncbi:MAG: dihydroorotate dehydrogenase electron transfer subunit [Candidatus Aureabacteria bacterium]|nr:dihydroorotate dehydrogenase electron transfer subunit [Candidatus Auribacterota bacterium]
MNKKITCGTRAIIENRKVGQEHFILRFRSAFHENDTAPGQFVSVKVDSPLMVLRRPLSVFDIEGNELSLFYKVVGSGTQALSQKKPGEKLDVLEVLGKGFTIDVQGRSVALVGGGMGVAPLFYLAKVLRKRKKDVHVYLGAQTAKEIFFEDGFQKMGCHVCVTTDDGSRNICGTVCCGLEPDCAKKSFQMIYACGPRSMLKAVSFIAEKAGIPCEVSLEEVMGCGFGVCLGCAVKVKDKENPYKMVCKDGPVFHAEDIDWK